MIGRFLLVLFVTSMAFGLVAGIVNLATGNLSAAVTVGAVLWISTAAYITNKTTGQDLF